MLILNGHNQVSGQSSCDSTITNLDERTVRLGEYVSALHNAHREKDFHFMNVLNAQIDQALIDIRSLEKSLANCPSRQGELKSPISSVKTQDDKYADMNCDGLKKKHIQLSRKFNALSRRQQSVLSEFTPEQKAEYRDTEESLKLVESELRKRCAPPQQNPAQRKLSPVERNSR